MWRPPCVPMVRLYFLDRLGWPVEMINGRPITNLVRLLLHTRRVTTRRPIALDAGIELFPYVPFLARPDFDVGSLNQKDIGVFRFGSLILPPEPWPRPMPLIGNITADDDTENMMKPEEKE